MHFRAIAVALLLLTTAPLHAYPINYVSQLSDGVQVSGLYPEYSNFEFADFYNFRVDHFTSNVWFRYTITQPDGDTSRWRARYFAFPGLYTDTDSLPSYALGSGLEFFGQYTASYAYLPAGDYTVLLTGYWDAWRARPEDIGYTFEMHNIASVPLPSSGSLLIAGLVAFSFSRWMRRQGRRGGTSS